MIEGFQWHSPLWFWLLLALPVWVFLRGRAGRSASLLFSSTAIAQEVSRTHRTRAGGMLLLIRLLAFTAIIFALARPRIGSGYEEIENSGIDIVLALDVSSSMQAQDFEVRGRAVSRLLVAKAVTESFIEKRPHDRIGLIAFARYPYLVSPVTLNHDWLLKNLNENVQLGRIEDGTAIGSAIGMAVNRLRELEDAKSRIVILLTDGENTAGDIPPVAAAEAAAQYDIRVYTIGAGTERHGRAPFDPETLEKIASTTQGRFFHASNTAELASIYNAIDKLEKTEIKLRKHQDFEELFYIPALIALAFLLLEMLLSATRWKKLP